jgi:hypothetical protein
VLSTNIVKAMVDMDSLKRVAILLLAAEEASNLVRSDDPKLFELFMKGLVT